MVFFISTIVMLTSIGFSGYFDTIVVDNNLLHVVIHLDNDVGFFW